MPSSSLHIIFNQTSRVGDDALELARQIAADLCTSAPVSVRTLVTTLRYHCNQQGAQFLKQWIFGLLRIRRRKYLRFINLIQGPRVKRPRGSLLEGGYCPVSLLSNQVRHWSLKKAKKECIKHCENPTSEDIFIESYFLSNLRDLKEGVTALQERRKPTFSGD